MYFSIIRQQSVDSLNGGFFTWGFYAVGRSGKKKRAAVFIHIRTPYLSLTGELDDLFHPISSGFFVDLIEAKI